jgi:hypothetical protein
MVGDVRGCEFAGDKVGAAALRNLCVGVRCRLFPGGSVERVGVGYR